MQVNDLVKVIADGEHKEMAGMIIRIDTTAQDVLNLVKLDLVDLPLMFADAELQFLGR